MCSRSIEPLYSELNCRHSSIGIQEQLLNDICYPADIVGRRIRARKDGSNLIKVFLDKNQQTNVEHKVNDILRRMPFNDYICRPF